MNAPKDEVVFTSLLDYLDKKHLEIDVLVFSGDAIDSGYISKHDNIVNSANEADKAKEWDKLAHESFELAEKYLDFLVKGLNLRPGALIICSGNHDVNNFLPQNEESDCNCHRDKNKPNFQRFSQFNEFEKNFYPSKSASTQSSIRTVDDFRFLVLDSNWVDKRGNGGQGLCINCAEVRKLLDDNLSQIIKNRDQNNINYNIVVTHAPLGDLCDYSFYKYLENDEKPIVDIIKENFGVSCAGHKHTYHNSSSEYIIVTKPDGDLITCGFHEYSENKKYSYRILKYNKNLEEWSVLDSKDITKKILAVSEPYLKSMGLSMLFLDYKNQGIVNCIESLDTKDCKQRRKTIDELFAATAKLQKPVPERAGTVVQTKKGIIKAVIEAIGDSQKSPSLSPLIVKGAPRVGKSIFMTILYVNMLFEFTRVNFDFIPVYYNLDMSIEKLDDNKYSWDDVKKDILKILEEGKKLSEDYEKPVCYIFDGLSQHKCYETSIEDYILDNQSVYKSTDKVALNRFIYCIDTNDLINLTKTTIDQDRTSGHLLYFNSISVDYVLNNNKYKKFVKDYCDLFGFENRYEDIISNIKELQVENINLDFLFYYYDNKYLQDTSMYKNLTELYNTILTIIFDNATTQIDVARDVSYYLYHERKTFDQIRNALPQLSQVSYQVFEKVRKNRAISLILLARKYVKEIENLIKAKKIDEKSIVNTLFDHNVTTFIRDIIDMGRFEGQLFSFSLNNFGKLTNKGKSTISYLCGRVRNVDEKERTNILKKQLKILKQSRKSSDKLECFFNLVAIRSIEISNLARHTGFVNSSEGYLTQLLTDNNVRRTNRDFYLLYYGDINEKELEIKIDKNENKEKLVKYKEVIYESFDIHNVFHVIVSHLKNWMESDTNTAYPLLSVELFTLCDLIQQRIDNPKSISRTKCVEQIIDSFFYNDKFNKPRSNMAYEVLNHVVEILEFFKNKYINRDSSDLFSAYIKQKHDNFSKTLEKLSRGKLDEKDIYRPENLLLDVGRVLSIKKSGWVINTPKEKITKEDFSVLNRNESLESTVEHIYESYLIGLFYLPEKSDSDSKYNKQKILNLILIHDIGEGEVDDYPPNLEGINDIIENEDKYNQSIFLKGIHDNIADLSEYLTLWIGWHKDTDDTNIRVAKDIDKIQMMYRMLMLLKEGKIKFTDERIKDMMKEAKKLKTYFGEHIYKILIKENCHFQKIISDRNIEV